MNKTLLPKPYDWTVGEPTREGFVEALRWALSPLELEENAAFNAADRLASVMMDYCLGRVPKEKPSDT